MPTCLHILDFLVVLHILFTMCFCIFGIIYKIYKYKILLIKKILIESPIYQGYKWYCCNEIKKTPAFFTEHVGKWILKLYWLLRLFFIFMQRVKETLLWGSAPTCPLLLDLPVVLWWFLTQFMLTQIMPITVLLESSLHLQQVGSSVIPNLTFILKW